MKTAITLWCIVAVGCKQSPVIQQSSGYATMTVFTSEKTLSNNYSASIRGKQDIDIYPQVSGFITKALRNGRRERKKRTSLIYY